MQESLQTEADKIKNFKNLKILGYFWRTQSIKL